MQMNEMRRNEDAIKCAGCIKKINRSNSLLCLNLLYAGSYTKGFTGFCEY